jgi:SNF family Na+-dependent transporter
VPDLVRSWYPVLFATAPVLWIAARSAGQYHRADLAVVLAAIAAVTVLAVTAAFLAARALGRRDRAAALAGALVTLAVAWCFYYLPVQDAVSLAAGAEDHVLVPAGVLATLAATIWLIRQPRERLMA